MSVQDLSNTKWTFYSDPALANLPLFELDYFSKDIRFSKLKCDTDKIKYDHLQAYAHTPYPYLVCSSQGPFILYIRAAAIWDGQLEYSFDSYMWTAIPSERSGIIQIPVETKSMGQHCIFLRGTQNTYVCQSQATVDSNTLLSVTGGGAFYFGVPSIIDHGQTVVCRGNIETLLDYQSVLNYQHPIVATGGFKGLFYDNPRLVEGPEIPCPSLPAESCLGMFTHTGITALPFLAPLSGEIAQKTFAGMFASTVLSSGILDLTQVTSLGDNSFRGIADAFCPEIYIGPSLQYLGDGVFGWLPSTSIGATSIVYGGHSFSLHFLFSDEDTPQFDVDKIVTPGLAVQAGKSKTITYKIYTDNTVIKNATVSKADEYTTVNVYHIDGSDWE